jgi:hypothetical protein
MQDLLSKPKIRKLAPRRRVVLSLALAEPRRLDAVGEAPGDDDLLALE